MDYTVLPWDSAFFGYPVVLISFKSLNEKSLIHIQKRLFDEQVKLAYFFVPENDKQASLLLKPHGAILVDNKITYTKKLTKKYSFSQPLIHSYLHHALTNALKSLALQSGVYSRFKVDSHFTKKQYEQLYTTWMSKSLSGEIARDVLVYKQNDTEVGVVTLQEKDKNCQIGLLAVDQHTQGKGIGTALLQSAFAKAQEWGYNELFVTTQQTNTVACAFYKKMGFREEKVEYVYHLWL